MSVVPHYYPNTILDIRVTMNATPNHDTLDNAITSDASLARINHDDENDPESQQDEASLHDDDPSLIAPTADIGRGVSQFITAMQQGGMSSTLDPSLASVQEGASSATPVDQQRFRPLKSRKAQHFLLGVLFLATTGVLVAFFLVLFKNQKSLSNAKRTTEPPRKDAPPTPPPRPNRQAHLEAITSLLETSGLATPSSFLEPTSPRTRALDWLVYQDQTLTRLDTAAHKHRLLQRYTLILFAFSTGVELWQTINPWIEMVQTQECSFAGIDCNSEGQVVGMQLPYWRLSGTLPDELGLVLTNMTSLVMNHNKLDGTIPETLFQLTHLRMSSKYGTMAL